LHNLAAALQTLRVRREDNSDDDAFQEAATAALEAARGAYSPYTKCPSAVALVSPMGIHCGSIVENAAHNPTLQPLQAAFANARFDGLTDYSMVALPPTPLPHHHTGAHTNMAGV